MAKVRFLAIDGLLEMQANNEKFVLVEVLSEDSYKKGHIPGAISMPADKLAEEAPKKLNKADTIVVYCASYACHASTNAAIMLMKMGYKNVLDFKGSKKAWVDAGLELET
ncbi:rhodanese-like domain-containing protein [Candidatus Woesearchaeota archaeon]|nr:rhodanese-like domain-containing protein [Candidatus Woesearchaeota archaeon]